MHLFRSTRRGEEGEGGCRATPAVGNAGRFGVFHHQTMRFPCMHITDGACSSVSSPFFPGLDRSSAECQVWCEVDQGDPAHARVRSMIVTTDAERSSWWRDVRTSKRDFTGQQGPLGASALHKLRFALFCRAICWASLGLAGEY